MRSLQADDPHQIGAYALLGRLGQGAMGTVYLGRSRGGRAVAVKVVRPELAEDPDFRERFRREVETARSVGGFWTAAVVDADPDAARPWLATEYVPGPTLQEAVDGHGPLPEPAVRRVAAGLAEALGAIHTAGLIHRDLKPSNVLLGVDGPRVIDFGISRALERSKLTSTGTVLGTPGFLSPEQIAGHDVGPPSDVFSLGAVLAYAATGRGPYGDGRSSALVYRAVHGEPDLSQLPAGLRPLVARCLRPDPSERPAPAGVLALLDHAGGVDRAGGVGPDQDGWLPPPVRTLVHRYDAQLRDRLAQAPSSPASAVTVAASPPTVPATPSTRPYPPTGPASSSTRSGQEPTATHPAGELSGGVQFRTSRAAAAGWGSAALVAALVAGQTSAPASGAGDLVRLVAFVAFIVLAVAAGRLLFRAVRPRRSVHIDATGLVLARGRRRWQLPWRAVSRLRIVEHRSKSWLVLWLADGWTAPNVLSGADFPGWHGGLRVFPVGHERWGRRRQREVQELRAALAWHAPQVYDQSP